MRIKDSITDGGIKFVLGLALVSIGIALSVAIACYTVDWYTIERVRELPKLEEYVFTQATIAGDDFLSDHGAVAPQDVASHPIHKKKELPDTFILLVGDSTDNQIVGDKCRSARGWLVAPTGSPIKKKKLQASSQFLNIWCKFVAAHLCPPGATGRAVQVCFLSKVILASVGNPYGVNPYGPWLSAPHTWLMESGWRDRNDKAFLARVRNSQHSLMTQLHNITKQEAFTALLGNQIRATIKFVGIRPNVVSVASNFWDASGLAQEKARFRKVMASKALQDQWMHTWRTNASFLLAAVAREVPESVVAWRLHHRINDASLPWAALTKQVSAAATSMFKEHVFSLGVKLVDLPAKFPKLQGVTRDGKHATVWSNVCYADFLISTLLNTSSDGNVARSCKEANGRARASRNHRSHSLR